MFTLNKLIKCDGKKPEKMNRAQFVNGTTANHSSLSVAHQAQSPLFCSKLPLPHSREVAKYFKSNSTYFCFTFLYAVFTKLHHPVPLKFWQPSLKASYCQWGSSGEPSSSVASVQTAGRCTGGDRCPSPCSVLVNIKKDVKCQVCFAR